MKKITLFMCSMVCTCSAIIAQSDITPARYVIGNQEVGSYQIDYTSAGWQPKQLTAEEIASFGDGKVGIYGGQAYVNHGDDGVKYIQSGLQIVNLPNIGKVLCLVGAGFTNKDRQFDCEALGVTKCSGTIKDGTWPKLSFWTDPTKTPHGEEGNPDAAQPIRISVTFKVISDDAGDAGSLLTKFTSYTNTKNEKAPTGVPTYNALDMMYANIDEEIPYALNEGWEKLEYDITIPAPAGSPASFVVDLSAGALPDYKGKRIQEGVLLIKEIKFTAGSDGAYLEQAKFEKGIKLTAPVRIENTSSESTISCTASDNILNISNAQIGETIDVYTVSGTQVASLKAASVNEMINLPANGLYIVKVGSKSLKAANY